MYAVAGVVMDFAVVHRKVGPLRVDAVATVSVLASDPRRLPIIVNVHVGNFNVRRSRLITGEHAHVVSVLNLSIAY